MNAAALSQPWPLDSIAGEPRDVTDTGARTAFLMRVFSAPISSGASVDTDICAYLFRLCGTLQAEYLGARGIDCLFDVEPGRFPKRVCDTLGLIVAALVMDAAENVLAGIRDRTITVTLRRRGAIWACAVAHSGSRVTREPEPGAWLNIAEVLAAELKADLRSQSSDRGMLTAVAFTVDPGTVSGPAAIAGRSAFAVH